MINLGQAARTPTRLDITPHLAEMRAALEQQRRFRVDQLQELDATTGSASDEPRNEVTLLVRAAAVAALADIDAALNRVQLDRFGRCQSCGTPIPLERLEILPAVRLCMRCHAAHERRTPRPLLTDAAPAKTAAVSAPINRLQR